MRRTQGEGHVRVCVCESDEGGDRGWSRGMGEVGGWGSRERKQGMLGTRVAGAVDLLMFM
jgi:hypothetical protein